MITYLNVQNFKLAEHVDLEFETGFSALTGETGAGKSLTIDALSLLLGERASPDTIASTASKAEIQGIFSIPTQHAAHYWLVEKELDEAHECIIRRVVSKKSASRAFVNGSAVTVQDLRTLGRLLVDIHGQHEQQLLVSSERQRSMLDAFANHQHTVHQLSTLYDQLCHLQDQYDSLQNRSDSDRERARLLEFQIQELEALNAVENEDEQLHQEYSLLSHSKELIQGVAETVAGLNESDGSNVARQLTYFSHVLSGLSQHDPELISLCERLDGIAIESDELANDLRRKLDTYEFDPEKMNMLQNRLDQLHLIARKYRVEVNDLADLLNRCKDELSNIAGDDETIQNLHDQITRLSKQYDELANVVSASRKSAAKRLGKAVSGELNDLGMKEAQFTVVLQPQDDRRSWGKESIHFTIQTNPSMNPGPLSKVASGGELSRVALAINVVTNQGVPALTQIYDEVDVGVGGSVAEMIGQKLRTVAANKQVLCVTHLAQVACQAEHHKKVNKANKDSGITITNLESQSRHKEIARMLGGIEITDRTLEHAAEMLRGAGGS